MSLFVLDTSGDQELLAVDSLTKPHFKNSRQRKLLKESSGLGLGSFAAELQNDIKDQEKEEYDFFGLPPPSVDISNIIENTLAVTRKMPSKVEQEMDYVLQKSDEAFVKKDQPKPKLQRFDLDHSDFNEMTGKRDELQAFKTSIEKELANSEMVPNLEQIKELPSITLKKQRELKRIERSKTKGKGWFNMPATELTEERENDLKILQMRSVLDPKHFYKKNDLKVLPKYFQVGTVQHSPLDYYNERDTRRNKKHTLVDELLADTEAQKYIKRKHKEIMINKQKYAQRKAMNKMKKLKKNKK